MQQPNQLQGLNTVIVWFRRDLRLEDNPALTAAIQCARNVIPVLLWAPEEEGQFEPGRYLRWWTKRSVTLLAEQLERAGSRLILRRATDTVRALEQLVHETGAEAVLFNHLYDAISLVRDHEVKQMLSKMGIACHSYNADLLYEPWEVLDLHDQPFTCFEEYWDRVLSMPVPPPLPLPPPPCLPPVSPRLMGVLPAQMDWFSASEQEASSDQLRFKWQPGVEGGLAKLDFFLTHKLHMFDMDRAKVDRESTSELSPWLHTGTLSVRYVFYRVCERRSEWAAQGVDISTGCKDFLKQLGYREYSRYLSFHYPFLTEASLLSHLRACPWRWDAADFKAWRQGRTGYPLVDAAMRQLWSTGWAHNRMRVVCSSFLVKQLLLPWQWGLKHFWDAQLDADLECDALGWQYVSGGMADAHPFSYVLNLEAEARRFDPDGEYVRRWLPVLSRLPTQYIHAPWTAPPEVLAAADVELGDSYPHRIITPVETQRHMDHACKVLQQAAADAAEAMSSKHPFGGDSGSAGGGGSGSQQQQQQQRRRQPYTSPIDILRMPPPPVADTAETAAASGAGAAGALLPPASGGGTGGGSGTATGTGTAYQLHRPESAGGKEEGPGAGVGMKGVGGGGRYAAGAGRARQQRQPPAAEESGSSSGDENEDAAVEAVAGGDGNDGEGDDEPASSGVSEAVDSNTVGLSSPQPSACSGFRRPGRSAAAAAAPAASSGGDGAAGAAAGSIRGDAQEQVQRMPPPGAAAAGAVAAPTPAAAGAAAAAASGAAAGAMGGTKRPRPQSEDGGSLSV